MNLINLSKKYGDRTIFSNVNYEFKKGNIYWIKGENGIGKSTFLRMLIGTESISSGEILDIPNKLLYIPEIQLTEDWLTIEENINFLYHISGATLDMEIDLKKTLNIKEVDYHTISMDCSTGTNMKVSFSLLFSKDNWDLIIIDEAFSHIDVKTQYDILNYINNICKTNGSIVIFTHHDSLMENIDDLIKIIYLKKEGIYE